MTRFFTICLAATIVALFTGMAKPAHAQTKRITWIDGKEYDITPVVPATTTPTTLPSARSIPAPATQALPGEKPSARNTGLKNPALLTTTQNADLFTESDGQVIENIDFVNAGITFQHDNVIVRNCRFTKHPTPFFTSPDGSGPRRGIRVEDCEISWSTPGDRNGTCVVGEGMSFYRSYIHGARDADWCNNGRFMTVEGCYFTDIGLSEGSAAHLDIFQWIGQTRMDLNVVFRGNYFDLPTAGKISGINAIVFTIDMTALTFENNWIKMGGGYALWIGEPATGVKINNNVFESWGFGPILFRPGGKTGTSWRDALEFRGNKVMFNGKLQPLETTGPNSRLFGRG